MEYTEMNDWGLRALGHCFTNAALLLEALTHPTFANENEGTPSNQRLEFLGDAVLGVVIAQYLFDEHPKLPEGELTKLRAAVVCEPSLADRSRALQVGEHLRFGKGEAVSGRGRDSILADAFEALVGAIYLDAGLEAARSFILRELASVAVEARRGQVRVDYKTRLQENLQRTSLEAPTYRLLTEEGPAHDKRFQVGVYHRGTQLGTGWGRNKKEAEQDAACQALGVQRT